MHTLRNGHLIEIFVVEGLHCRVVNRNALGDVVSDHVLHGHLLANVFAERVFRETALFDLECKGQFRVEAALQFGEFLVHFCIANDRAAALCLLPEQLLHNDLFDHFFLDLAVCAGLGHATRAEATLVDQVICLRLYF